MTAEFPRQWFPCCGHCLLPDDDGRGHPVPCLACQTDSPRLFDVDHDDPRDVRDET